MFIIVNEEKGYGIELTRYNGLYSLTACWQKDEKMWCNINYLKDGKRKFIDKPIPLGVRLGDRELAIFILRRALREMEQNMEDRI